MRIRSQLVLSLEVALAIAAAASAQRRPVPAAPAAVGLTITLQVAGQPYRFEGNAACRHAPIASIYSVAAAMWGIQQSDGQRSFSLTLWRPKSVPGDAFSLHVAMGGKSFTVNTVKFGGTNSVRGSGRVTLTPSGAGATFAIDATAANGAAISGTIRCGAFTPAVAEGG